MNCWDCKYRVQGEGCVTCCNPLQGDKEKYTYHSGCYDTCDCNGFEKGIFNKDVMTEVGWTKASKIINFANGEKELFMFYKKDK